ncbi:L-serine dehydratase (alpha chain) [Acetoanaerobium sticklandii]|uniref:L-serine dehydratase n=1 Tax=Acetoanaerobium sticklandii (strain ATCC 12662 / DSM 519 / JCM 1433 / CCUG 9281 / NCIMB 10654 / HF) TaxID=499177 RepID=E3PRI0_ACESD|nr:L-serine ammonia-lyase, iron-sulfur-dependent, subunit alpha [Acetoanaerobium sticklandii]CBH21484.1 L-serine dehydratase (alpha chain) [Acetoanaerobium sticklandii]
MKFNNGKELLDLCSKENLMISDIMIKLEMNNYSKTEDEVFAQMHKSFIIMKNAVHKSLTEDIKSMGGLIGGEAKKLIKQIENNKNISGLTTSKAMAYAMGVLEVNASMGLIVAAPTAGSCGIIPGVLTAIQEAHGFTDEQMTKALFTAAGIGMVVTMNATVAGAEGGCQAETGSAAAMASAAVCELMGGTPKQCLDAAAICIKNIMGLICDPIAGLVEAPCQKRNAIGATNSLISAEMTLAGIDSIIPFDEVVESMYKVGRSMPVELRETALGGVAATATGCTLCSKIFN